MNNKKDPYASEAETQALLVPDTRTAAERKLDQILEERGASEQGAESALILRQIALELLAEQLAQQGPVAIVAVDGIGQIQIGWIKKPQHNDKLYTTPQPAQRKPLTDEQAVKIVQGVVSTSDRPIGAVALGLLVLRASETAHSIKE